MAEQTEPLWDDPENWDVIGDIERALNPEIDPKTGWPKKRNGMVEHYAADMDWEAKAQARHTGIAAGWLQSTEPPTYLVGCCKCGIAYKRVVSIAELDEYDYYFGKGMAERRIEEMIHHVFVEKAKEFDCPHYQHYIAAKKDPMHQKLLYQEAFNDWADYYLESVKGC